MILNGLPWKQTDLGLHPNTAFWTILLTMMATPFFSKGFLPTVVDIMVI